MLDPKRDSKESAAGAYFLKTGFVPLRNSHPAFMASLYPVSIDFENLGFKRGVVVRY